MKRDFETKKEGNIQLHQIGSVDTCFLSSKDKDQEKRLYF